MHSRLALLGSEVEVANHGWDAKGLGTGTAGGFSLSLPRDSFQTPLARYTQKNISKQEDVCALGSESSSKQNQLNLASPFLSRKLS